MNKVESLFKKTETPQDFAKGYLNYLGQLLNEMDSKAIGAFIKTILDARERGSQIFFIGNGGSAATASHFANDIGVGTRSSKKPFRAMSLTDNVASMTAIANDYGYEDVFTKQLQIFLNPKDVVVAISASGNSPNLLKAIEWAKGQGAFTVGLTGFDGGALQKMSDLSLHVPTQKGEYGPVEDAHMVIDHLVGGYLMYLCRAEAERN